MGTLFFFCICLWHLFFAESSQSSYKQKSLSALACLYLFAVNPNKANNSRLELQPGGLVYQYWLYHYSGNSLGMVHQIFTCAELNM